MRLHFNIPIGDNKYRVFGCLNNSDYDRIFIENLVIIDIFKIHNHSYCFKAFFYHSKRIYSTEYYNTKSNLYCAIQKLLQEELSHV